MTDRSDANFSTHSQMASSLTNRSMAFRIDQGELMQALEEVKHCCSDLCFEVIEKVVLYRTEERPKLKKAVERELKSNKELQQKFLR